MGASQTHVVINRSNARAEGIQKERDYEAFINVIAAACRRLIAVRRGEIPIGRSGPRAD